MGHSRLAVLKQVADGIAAQFGDSCEVVVHDLSRKHLSHSIVHIVNGHISGREVGSGASPAVLKALRVPSDKLTDQYAYLTKTDNGRILKSTTIYIKEDDGTAKYVLGINFDITTLVAMNDSIRSLITCPKAEGEEDSSAPKNIPHDVNALLDELIDQSVAMVGVPVTLMTKADKIKALNYLNDAGAFLITKSGEKIAKFFGISKYTLYSYVDINK